MVVRPSLKRVVPGSVPPWRALCGESARSESFLFNSLCFSRVSESVLLLKPKFGRFLGRGLLPAREAAPRRSFVAQWSRVRLRDRARLFFVTPS